MKVKQLESDGLGQLHVGEFDRVGVIALSLVLAVALVEDVVDLVDQQIHGFVHLLGFCRTVDVRAAELDVGLGDELVRVVVLAVTFKLDPDSHDMGLVAKQSFELILYKIFEGGSEVEMDAGHDDIVGVVVLVHGFSFGLTTQKAGELLAAFLTAMLVVQRTDPSDRLNNRFIVWTKVYVVVVVLQFFSASSLRKIIERSSMIHATEPLPPIIPPLVAPEDLPKWVILSDDRLLVIDKPGWLVVHPSKNGPWSSLAGAVREGLALETIRFIYRLDRETSGVIILAKDEATGSRLGKAVLKRRIGKAYVTLLEGELTAPVTVNQSLGPDPTANVSVKSRVVAAGTEGAQEAHTVFHPLVARNGFTLAGVELLTGRKHQIRAHAEWLQHRVLGDKLYGPDPTLYLEFATQGWTARHSTLLPITRQALHCAAIDLRSAGMDYLLRAPWPEDLARFAAREMNLPADEAQALIDAFIAEKLPG